MVIQLSINADEYLPDAYKSFVTQLRESATKELVKHTKFDVGILPETEKSIPHVLIATGTDVFTLHIRNFDMYFLGYKISDQLVSIGKSCRVLDGELAKHFTAFSENYRDMGLSEEERLTRFRLGHNEIITAMTELKRFVQNPTGSTIELRQRACATVALMICEAARFDNVSEEINKIYKDSGLITTDAADFIKHWAKKQKAYDNNDEKYDGPLRLVQKKFYKKPSPVRMKRKKSSPLDKPTGRTQSRPLNRFRFSGKNPSPIA